MNKLLKSLTVAGLLAAVGTGCGQIKALTPTQLAEHNKPGTLMIQTVHEAKFSVPDYEFNQVKLDQLYDQVDQRIISGILTSDQKVFVALVEAIYSDPLSYFTPIQERIQDKGEVTFTGSALAITEDGFLVTNAHVISPNQDELKQSLAGSTLQDMAVESCQAILYDSFEDHSREAIGAIIGTQNFLNLCVQGHVDYFVHHLKIEATNTNIYAAMGATTRDRIVEEGYKATVRATGEVTPGKDVAILKIEASQMPTVALGDDKPLTAGDRIFILGYPGAGVVNEKEAVEPSLTAGLVSARKTMPDGWDILQTDAAMSGGNSGGPVFNEVGEVIGIATFAAVDPTTGGQVQGGNFVIPISVVDEFLQEAKVSPELSPISQIFQQAIGQFDQGRFKAALETFRQVNEMNPNYPYVQGYLSKTQMELNRNKSQSPSLWSLATIGSAALLVIGGTFVLRRRGQIPWPKSRLDLGHVFKQLRGLS